jgi:hypothetical protein
MLNNTQERRGYSPLFVLTLSFWSQSTGSCNDLLLPARLASCNCRREMTMVHLYFNHP